MNIVLKGKERELKFTFNSFLYMEEFDIGVLQELETKPFKIIQVTRQLLLGATNWNPKERVSPAEVSEFVQELIDSEDGDISELLTSLIEELEKSNFFKQLQKTAEPEKQAKKRK